ncbi:hypothetical protein CVT25_011240 [Psilocybe cyanescens]|uniref:Uncharacterized protein n=1 Tax=Psilocybe cyanescens TaxID=93625 RepID=A0A409WGG4_PSICY|nr:hypothetical protein CVT25_011240 [Psilocybe cyanescens]
MTGLNAVSALYFSVTHAAITISEYRVPPPRNSLPTYRIYICCRDPSDLPTLFPLLDAYASCNFSDIETLHFDVDLFTDQRLNVDVFRFLARLHSVKSLLYSNEGTIPSLHSLARDSLDADETSGVVPASLFPHLHTIKVDSARSNLSSYITSPKEVPLELVQLQQVLSKFVIWRRVLQHPIQVVDITDLGAAAIVGIFDGIEGLQVIIRTEP